MVLLNAFSVPMMLSATNVALPTIANELHLNAVVLSWVPMTFLMASAMAVLVFGRLADMFGRKRIFLTGTTVLILTSLLVASANNGATLLGARFLQGTSAAMVAATQMAIISSAFAPQQRGRMIGWVVGAVYVGLSCGPLIGGYLVENISWRATFLAHAPLALVVWYLGYLRVDDEWRGEPGQRFDIGGALTYGFTIALLCTGVSLLPHFAGGVLLALGGGSLVVFLQRARTKTHPIWNVNLFFTNRLFTLSCLASLFMYTATYANIVLVSLYLQYLQQMSAAAAGWVMMVQPATMAVFSPLFGRLSDRLQPRLLASGGMLLTAAGLGGLSQLTADSVPAHYIGSLVCTGLGFSLFSSPNVNAIMGAVDNAHLGHAASAVATMRIMGQLSSMVIVTMVMALTLGQVQIEPSQFPRLETAIQTCFSVAAGFCILGSVLSFKRGQLHR